MSTLSRGEIHWVDGSYPGNRMNLDRTVSIVDQYAQTIRNWVDSGVIRYALEITVISLKYEFSSVLATSIQYIE